MREFKKRRSTRSEVAHFGLRIVGTLALLFITIGMVRAAWDMYGRLQTATVGQQDAEAQLRDLKTQQAAVSASAMQLSSVRGQEAVYREHYGVARPGEGVVQIVAQASTTNSQNKGPQGWFSQLFHALFSW